MAKAEAGLLVEGLKVQAMTKTEVAQMLSTSISTIDRLLQAGELRGMRLGRGRMGKVVIPVEEIQELKRRRAAQFVTTRAKA